MRRHSVQPNKQFQIDLIQTLHELNNRSSSRDINYGTVHPETAPHESLLYPKFAGAFAGLEVLTCI